MAKNISKLTNPETGEVIYVDESLIPGSDQWGDQDTIEVDWSDMKQGQVVPIGPEGLKIDVFAGDKTDEQNNEPVGQPGVSANIGIESQPENFAPEENLGDDYGPVEYIGNSIKGRGNNWAGGARNLFQGLAFGAGDEIEAYVRSLLGDKSYDEYLQNARDSYKGYAAEHPGRATAMQIGGALLPSLLTFGATAPATAALTTGRMIGRGALTGLGMGGLQGYLTGEGNNRINNAITNAGIGGLVGGVAPAAIKGGQNVLSWASQIRKGMGKNVSRTEAGRRMINLVSGANDDYIDNTMYLGLGAMKGEEGIQKAAKDINVLRKEAQKATQKGYNPNVVDGYSDLTQSLKTPEMLAADKAYVDFAAKVPEGTNSGMAIDAFFKKHPAAKDIYLKYGEKMPNVKPNSFEGMRDINEALRNKLKRAVASKDEALVDDIMSAQKDLSVIRENTTPGIKAIDKAWSKARNKQDVVDDIFFDNVKKIANPKELLSPEVSTTGVARTMWPARVRGMSRELLETGKVAPAGQGKFNQAVENILAPLKDIGVGKFKIGPVPTTRAGQAIWTDYQLSNENLK